MIKPSIQFNHHIVFARDKRESAQFLTGLFGMPPPRQAGMFLAVEFDNGVRLDDAEPGIEFPGQHYAFLVGEHEFDLILGRIRERGIEFWADPGRRVSGEYNSNDGGRGLYFMDPSGHGMEIITKPYAW